MVKPEQYKVVTYVYDLGLKEQNAEMSGGEKWAPQALKT